MLCVEHGSDTQRGRNGAWTQVGPSLGTLIATGMLAWIAAVLSPAEFQAWGWRLPFLASVFLVGLGLWIRRGIGETPVYQELQRSELKSQAPISEVLRLHWRGVLRVIGARIGPDVWYSLVVVFSLSYLATVLGLPRPLALISLSIGLVFNVLTEVFFGGIIGQARPPCGVRRGSNLNCDLGVCVLCTTRHAPTAADYDCHSRRIDCSRDDVRPSGCLHHRAISNSCAICGLFHRLHAGRNRRWWNRACNFRNSVT